MKILIIGQNGSGKSTLANKLVEKFDLAYLELDEIWLEMNIPSAHKANSQTKKNIDEQLTQAINKLIDSNENWVCEGFYGFAMNPAAQSADQIIFIDLPLPKRMINQVKRMLIKRKTNPDFSWVNGTKFLYSMIGRTYRTKDLLKEFASKYNSKTLILKSHKEVHEWLSMLT